MLHHIDVHVDLVGVHSARVFGMGGDTLERDRIVREVDCPGGFPVEIIRL